MEIGEINGVPLVSADSDSLTGAAGLAETFDNFLTLLTTQLQNQDPLSPLDTNEFTQQLVQFTGVEQALKTNDKLDDLIALQGGTQLTQAVNYIGKTVSADSVTVNLQNGSAVLTYDLAAAANDASILIFDQAGTTVRTMAGPTEFGHHEIVWDGTDNNGNSVPDGTYGFLVTAVDEEQAPVALVQGINGRVTGVKQDEGEIILQVGDIELRLEDVLSVGLADENGGA